MKSKGAAFVCSAVVVAAFGPYVYGGLRTEQVAVYGIAVLTAAFSPWRWLWSRPTQLTVAIFGAWGLYALVGLLGVLLPTTAYLPWPRGSVPAGIDNLLLPLAVLSLTAMCVRPDTRTTAIEATCRAVAVLGAANGLLALAMTRVDLSMYLARFWAPPQAGETVTVAGLAAQLGRVSGVFNQPAEAGLMYGLAGIAAVYVWSARPRLLYPALMAITVGGLLCVSKVFIIGGLPVICWQVWRSSRRKLGFVMVAAIAVAGVVQSGLLAQWTGLDYLGRLLSPGDHSLMEFYTAGRLGRHSTLSEVTEPIWRTSPLSGVGAAGVRAPYDNGWVEALVVAGVIGVVCYTVTLLLLARLARRLDGRDARLAWGLVVVATAASVGLPALTANRAGALLWLLAGLLLVRRPDLEGDGRDLDDVRVRHPVLA